MSENNHLPDPNESGVKGLFLILLKAIGWLLVIAAVGLLLLAGTCFLLVAMDGFR